MLALLYVAFTAAMSRAVVRSYAPQQAKRVVSKWNEGDTVPRLPAYVMHVDGAPTAALFYDNIGSDLHAIRFVYNATAMSRRGHMNACRRMLDRKSVDYDTLSMSEWFALVGSTDERIFFM